MSGESKYQFEALLGWYKKNLSGRVEVERLGLDGHSVLIAIRGRRELKLLITTFDPSEDGDFLIWIRSLIQAHKRAGIEFDRVEVWVPPEDLEDLQEELDNGTESEEKWLTKITIRSVRDLYPSETAAFIVPKKKEKERNRAVTIRRQNIEEIHREMRGESQRKSEKLEEYMKDVVNELKAALRESMESILSEVKEERNQIEIMNKLHELEKRVELLEAMIKLMGRQFYPLNQPEPVLVVDNKLRMESHSSNIDSKENAKIARNSHEGTITHQGIDINKDKKTNPPSDHEADEVFREILNNPWVEILRKKEGENIES